MEQKRISRKQWRYITIFILICMIGHMNPTAFSYDGTLTRQMVADYKTQYDLGMTKRHESGVERIYMFYFGFKKVSVQTEKEFIGYDIEVKKIAPFLYQWERNWGDCAFRVTIGERKYYFTIVST